VGEPAYLEAEVFVRDKWQPWFLVPPSVLDLQVDVSYPLGKGQSNLLKPVLRE